MIIGCDLMVQLGLSADFKRQVIQRYVVALTMKEPRGLLRKSELTSRKIHKVVIQASEPVSTRETT